MANKILAPLQRSPSTITVIGGGVMGALASLLAASLGHSVTWFGPKEQGRTDGADARNYALAPLTVDLLKRLGVWAAIEPHGCVVARMEVSSGDTRVDLSATDSGSEYLSIMVLHRDLLDSLEQAVTFQPQIHRIETKPDELIAHTDRIEIVVGKERIATKLVVGADGARSWVRGQSGITWGQRDYAQQAVVAAFRTEHAHGGIAVQWFDDGDILALLPLADAHMVSMVLSTDLASAQAAQSDPNLAACITDKSHGRFGALELKGPVTSAPLRMLLSGAQSALRTVLVGDAAHTVHPLAGYGLNLGVQDLLALETIWKESKDDPGAYACTQAYERARRRRVARVQWGLDILQRFVTQSHPSMAGLRRWGMRMVADIGPLRQLLVRQAISPQ
jgi:ubiquinone biosynthesis UbiH/UbiF/VisC/COQ6 family hydroxylase